MDRSTTAQQRSKRNDTTVKIATSVYRKAKQVAVHRSIPLAEYLSELLDKPVARDFHKLRADLDAEVDGQANSD